MAYFVVLRFHYCIFEPPTLHGCFFSTNLVHALQGPVPERLISVNSGLKFSSVFVLYIPMYCLGNHFVLSLLYLVAKAQQYFVPSSCMFFDEKTVLKIWLNPGLKLSIFQGTGPWSLFFTLSGHLFSRSISHPLACPRRPANLGREREPPIKRSAAN